MNKVILGGTIGAELSDIKNGVKFSLATKEWNSKENKEETEWHQCLAFGKTAEYLKRWGQKGSYVVVEDGLLRTSQYTKEGEDKPRYNTTIWVNKVEIVTKRKKKEGEPKQQELKVDEGDLDFF